MIQLTITDDAQMEQAGNGFHQVGGEAGENLTVAISTIEGLGGCWGGDPAGQAFWSSYRGPATTTVANASQVGDQVTALGDNTLTTLTMYKANEETGAALTQGIYA